MPFNSDYILKVTPETGEVVFVCVYVFVIQVLMFSLCPSNCILYFKVKMIGQKLKNGSHRDDGKYKYLGGVYGADVSTSSAFSSLINSMLPVSSQYQIPNPYSNKTTFLFLFCFLNI